MRIFVRALYFFFGGILLLGLGFVLLAFLTPSDFIKDKIVTEIKLKTGRDLIVSGPTSFALYPSLGFKLQDVSLSGPPGFSGSHFLTLKGLSVGLELMPLLKQDIKINHIVLTHPIFHFEIDKSGSKSWEFEKEGAKENNQLKEPNLKKPPSSQPLQSPKPSSEEPSSLPLSLFETASFGEVRVVNGTMSYGDLRTGKTQILRDLNLVLKIPTLKSTAHLSGRFTWQGESFNISSDLTSPLNLLSSKPAQLKADVTGGLLSGFFDGTLTNKLTLESKGSIQIQAPSLTNILAFFHGNPLQEGKTDTLSLSGKISSYKTVTALTAATFKSTPFEGKGEILVMSTAERPLIKAQLNLSDFNISELLSTAQTGFRQNNLLERDQMAGEKGASRFKFASPLRPPAPKDLDRPEWSEEPYNFGTLANADLQASLSTESGVFKGIKFGKSQMLLSLKNSRLEINFSEVELYEGLAKGVVSLDAKDPKSPEMNCNLEISTLQIQPLLQDAGHTEWLMGKGSMKFLLTGKGPSQRAIINSLSGSAELNFQDGAIVGLNIGGLFRNVSQGSLATLKSSPTEKTDFSELTSTWSIQGGIAKNEDLQLLSPLLRVSGSGNVQMPERTLEYVLRPKIVSDLTGQGGKIALTGLEIPIRVHGSWDNPKFSPDLKDVLKDPNKAVETIKEIGKQLKGKNAAEIVKGLLGNSNNSSQPANSTSGPNSSETTPSNEVTPAPKTSKTEEFLKQFLKPQ